MRCRLPDSMLRLSSSFDPMGVPPHSTTRAGGEPMSGHMIYHSQPIEFVTGLAHCMLDEKCHILYQHVQKTGGKGVESLLFSIFGHSYDTCCGQDMLDRFRANPRKFCLMEFSSYEVMKGFDEIVNTCHDKFYNDVNSQQQQQQPSSSSSSPRHRFIILTSIREPVELTLSAIHQICNKRWNKRDERVQAACTACSFTADKDYWMRHPKRVVQDYSTVVRQAATSLQEFDHYWVDTIDLNVMFRQLHTTLYPLYDKQFKAYFNTKHNAERLDHCEFSMHSKMIKELRPSSGFYRNFTRGFITAT